jgi:hypothetical protein
MKKINQNQVKKMLIKIINDNRIDDIIYEPRYCEGYELQRALIGSTITIRTSLKGRKK